MGENIKEEEQLGGSWGGGGSHIEREEKVLRGPRYMRRDAALQKSPLPPHPTPHSPLPLPLPLPLSICYYLFIFVYNGVYQNICKICDGDEVDPTHFPKNGGQGDAPMVPQADQKDLSQN